MDIASYTPYKALNLRNFPVLEPKIAIYVRELLDNQRQIYYIRNITPILIS